MDKLTVTCGECDFVTGVHPHSIEVFTDKIKITTDCDGCCKLIVVEVQIPEE
jgi:hypothetical protein